MLTLEALQTLQGQAGTASVITWTAFGNQRVLVPSSNAYKRLGQGQLGVGVAAMLTVAAGEVQQVVRITFSNTSASPVTGIKFFVGGAAGTNQIMQLAIPANGSATYGADGWKVYDSNGNQVFSATIVLTGDVTGSGTGTIATTTVKIQGRDVLATAPNTGQALIWNGAAWAPTDTVNTLTATDASMAVGGTAFARTVATGTPDQIFALHPPAGAVNFNAQEATNAATPTASTSLATKGYVDNAVVGLSDFRGDYDASTNLFPAAGGSGLIGNVLKGDTWVISVGGTLGGQVVTIGDWVFAKVDTPGQVAANWSIIEHNFTYVPEDVANKSNDGTMAANSTTLYPTQNAVRTYLTTNYQPLDATLTALAGPNWALNSTPRATGPDTMVQQAIAINQFMARASTGDYVPKAITDFGLSLVDDANQAAAQTTLGLLIGTNVQAFDQTLAALAAADWVLNSIPIGTGADTLSQTNFAINTFPARASTGNLVAKPITDVGLAWLALSTVAAETAALDLATAALKGLMSPAQWSEHENYFNGAIYNVVDWGMTTSDLSGTPNLNALNTLLAAAPAESTILFPPGRFLIDGAPTIPAKHLRFMGSGNNGKTIIVQRNPTADFFGCTDWYQTFENMSFEAVYTTVPGAVVINTTPSVLTVASNVGFYAASSGYVATANGYALISWTGAGGGGTTLTGVTVAAGSITTTAGGPLVHKTAGAAINAGNLVGINADRCSFQYLFNGYVCAGATTNVSWITRNQFFNVINFGTQIDGANWNGIYTENVADCATTSRTVAHLELNRCGSILMSDNDLIRATNNFRINATTAYPAGVFGVHSTNDFFDTAGGSCVKLMGIGAIQRVKFNGAWFSSGVNGLEFASTAGTLPTAIDLVNCEVYSNSANGILAPGTGVQDWSATACRIAGNATAGVNATAAATHKFLLNNNTIGPTGGIGANGTGLLVAAGTYGSYLISDNNVEGNTTANINDLGDTAFTDQKFVGSNLGHLIYGIIGTAASPVTIPITTETMVVRARVPAKAVQAFQMFRWNATVITTGANVGTWRVRIGTTGTTADATVANIVVTAAGVANGRSNYQGEYTIRTLGAPGTAEGEGRTITTSTAPNVSTAASTTAAAATTTAVTTTAIWWITVSYASPTAAATGMQGYIEAL